jgi:uncharacterized protein YbaR (Trm112 family)
MTVSKDLLKILACPKCKGVLILKEESATRGDEGLICDKCKLLYPIRGSIPVMLIDEAIPIG